MRIRALANEAVITLKINVGVTVSRPGSAGCRCLGRGSSGPRLAIPVSPSSSWFPARAKCSDAVKIRFASKGV